MNEGRRDRPAKMCLRCLVAGRVQGVFYRASARFQAQALGITGYARNLADGRVEVLACGEPEALARFQEWLRQGPSGAWVSGVSCEPVDYRDVNGFATR